MKSQGDKHSPVELKRRDKVRLCVTITGVVLPLITWIYCLYSLGDDIEMFDRATSARLVFLFATLFVTEIGCLVGSIRYRRTKMARWTGATALKFSGISFA